MASGTGDAEESRHAPARRGAGLDTIEALRRLLRQAGPEQAPVLTGMAQLLVTRLLMQAEPSRAVVTAGTRLLRACTALSSALSGARPDGVGAGEPAAVAQARHRALFTLVAMAAVLGNPPQDDD